MSTKLSCCLCNTPCTEYKSLQNDFGECNEIYEITVKYFDPMLLTEYINTTGSKESIILCQDCWLHIKDFDEFHRTVINSRSSLQLLNAQKSPLHIKLEEEQIIVELNDKNYVCTDNGEVEHDEISIKNDKEDNLNNIENDFQMVNNSDNDEDQPLINLKRSHNDTIYSIESVNKTPNNITETKTRKVRKSKSSPKNSSKLDSDNVDENYNNKYLSKAALEKVRESNEFIAEWKSVLECDICHETFAIFDLLKFHFKCKHNSKCYVKCCERKFYRRSDLVEHIRAHINPDTLKCDICGKHSSSKYNLKVHKTTVHGGNKKFECQQCHKTFKQKPNLERHLLTHATGSKDFKCEECDRSYILEVQLKSHIKLVHSDRRICEQCGKTLSSLAALKLHLSEHNGIEKPTFPCDECGTLLKSRINLKRHKDAYHNDGSTIYVCSICGKVAASERGLMNHRKYMHEKERIHKCDHCSKSFKRPKTLAEHIATHTGQDLYQCSYCPRTFKISSKFYEHRKKAHPVEWEESRKNRLEKHKIDLEQVKNQIFL